MKLYIKVLALVAIFSGTFISCQEEYDGPIINLTELGFDNTKTVQQGADLHIDAEILANLKIASIQVILHKEEEGAAHIPMKIGNALQEVTVWTVDSTYTTNYVGLKNADFHEHLKAPATAELGNYHLHLKVTDLDGNQTIVEEDVQVLAGN